MSDSRQLWVLAGAAALIAALFAPWYALDLSGAARDAIGQQTGQLPKPLDEFARGLLSVLPERIVANAWETFERGDIVVLGCALAAGFSALLARFDVAALAGGGAAVTVVLAMVDKPGPGREVAGPGGDIVQLQWGPWVALAAAGLIVVAAGMSGRRTAPSAPEDWSTSSPQGLPSAAMVADRPGSVAPPGGRS